MAANSDYSKYSVDDFIKDEFFQRWVYFPDAENTAFWERFLLGNPGKAEDVEEAIKFLKLLNFGEGDVFGSKITALKKRIDFAIDHPDLASRLSEKSTGDEKTGRPWPSWLKIAASLLLLAVAVMGITRYRLADKVRQDVADISEQITNKGERTIISLEDGTKVWLNVDSRIRYPESFKGKVHREVYLDGEAFFDVAENKSQPFIVRTEGVQIRVLGTSFNVKSYEKEDQIQTTLVKGKVTIESMDSKAKVVTLAPNQMATYHKTSGKIVLNNQTDLDVLAGWKEGRLIFDNRPLSEIVVALERWYNIRITVEDDNSLKCHFSAKIENLTLGEVLELFKASDGIEYTIDGQEVIIRGSICEN